MFDKAESTMKLNFANLLEQIEKKISSIKVDLEKLNSLYSVITDENDENYNEFLSFAQKKNGKFQFDDEIISSLAEKLLTKANQTFTFKILKPDSDCNELPKLIPDKEIRIKINFKFEFKSKRDKIKRVSTVDDYKITEDSAELEKLNKKWILNYKDNQANNPQEVIFLLNFSHALGGIKTKQTFYSKVKCFCYIFLNNFTVRMKNLQI